MRKLLLALVFILGWRVSLAQVKIDAHVFFSPASYTISVSQNISYTNSTADTLTDFYLNDWANSFESKVSPLGQHFSSIYVKRFHYSKLAERGFTKLEYIRKMSGKPFSWIRPKGHPDILKLQLDKPLLPDETIHISLKYVLRIPEDKFTGFGRDGNGNYNLRYWLITPARYRKSWQIYSNKDLNDLFQPRCQARLILKIPNQYEVISTMDKNVIESESFYKSVELTGQNLTNFRFELFRTGKFYSVQTENGTVLSNISDMDLSDSLKTMEVRRIMGFLKRRLGAYPHKKLMVTQADYKENPVYGLNQLPSFIRPFSDGFQYDIKMMKAISHAYLNNSILVNPRKSHWVLGAIEIKLLMDYASTYYPDEKLIGSLSDIIGIRWSHLADLGFNYQYQFLFMNMNRLNIDQPLRMRRDSLLKFNQEIANPYKAGVGLNYLEDFLGDDSVRQSIREFYRRYVMKPVSPDDFEQVLKANARKDIDWFFDQYVNTNVRLDFTIKSVKKLGDSLQVTIKNKEDNSMPVSLFGLNGKKVVSEYWVEHTAGKTTVTIPAKDITRLGLNYDGVIPEINQRNNYKGVSTFLNKPIQFRLLTDIEDPHYNQFYIMPRFNYNLYDGFVLGPTVYNRTFLHKRFTYQISPMYGFKAHDLVGSLSVFNTHQFRNDNLSAITYGLTGSRFSYNYDLFYYRFSPSVGFTFRHKDLRDNQRQYINLRNVTVYRDHLSNPVLTDSLSGVKLTEEPNYTVFDLQYVFSDRNFIDYMTASFDFQVAQKFSKVSISADYRKLFLNNRQIEFRFFAGAFLYNHSDENSHYFSFALDRPTDYMFDYNYLGRSESSGLLSQQYIAAEGGFKSKLQPAFANRWLTTFGTSASIWRNWLYAYGDIGLIKNHGIAPKVRYDSGIRLSLVQDYFELYFPVYSSLGWEIGQAHYAQRIRFMASISVQTLLGIFERKFY